MKDLVRIFKSPDGDVYHIELSEDKGVLSQEVLESLGNVHVVGIECLPIFTNSDLFVKDRN